MWERINQRLVKLKTVLGFIAVLLALTSVTPVLAEFLGPDRKKTETVSSCQVNLLQCQYVEAKDDWIYKVVNDWLCSNESKPWKSYPSSPSADCSPSASGDKYWEKDESTKEVTKTYPAATITGTLENCTLNNGWCTTSPQLTLEGTEPVSGYKIIALEGTLNGQTFSCVGATCSVPLVQGDNVFTYWALSSWGDSSKKGLMTVSVDSQGPVLSGTLNGSPGSNGWYSGSITFDGSASDALSGLQSFTCTLDGAPLAVCNAISISSEGPHTLVMNASDNAGNTSLLSQSLSIDTQPPALSTSIQGTLGSNNWYNVAKLSASATDPSPGSGIFVIEYNIDNTGWILFPTSGELDLPEGKHDLDIRALDYVGHSASSSKSFSLDNAVPTITVDPLGTLGLNNWYVTQLDLSADASDNISGVDIFEYARNGSPWTSYTTPLHLTDGSHSISFWAQDKAGLVRQVDQNYFVDTRPPQIAGTISGTPGTNGWYVSDVTLSASAADPTPGSGMEAFSYNLDGAGQLPYTAALTLPDGTHTLQLIAQDKAGLTYSTEQTIQVDTVRPALNISTSLPAWNKGKLTWNGTSSDSGSGISKVEVSTNGGKTWQLTTGTASWSFEWDTVNDPNGIQTMLVRATDNAGLATEQALQVGIDNQSPKISMPASWLQWDSITLDIWDDESGLSTARIEISDPEGKHPNRVIDLSIDQFPLRFKWDRRFGDDKVAPYGKYDVSVTTVDKVGNSTQQTASIKVLLEILPAGPTSTPQPYSRIVSTSTPVYTSTPAPLPTSTSTAVVSAFGEIPPTAQSTPTPVATLEPRTAPTQTSVLDWLESIFTFNSTLEGETTTVESFSSPTTDSTTPEAEVPVLWGSIAAAVVGVLSEHAAEWRRRQEEARAEKLKEEAEEDERREKRQEQKMEKLEQQWAQERAWEQARLQKEQEALDRRNDFMESKMDRIDAEDDAQWLASQIIIEKREEEKKKKEELKAGLEAYYSGRKQGEAEAAQPTKKNWWQKSLDWIDKHQTEIALGIGITVGAAAIVMTGGIATPLVAAGWMAGAAVVAGGVVAGGTIALNNYYDRDWNDNLLGNVLVAGVAAAAVTGIGFLLQAASSGAATYCVMNPNICTRIEPLLNTIDAVEEVWTQAEFAYHIATGNPDAAQTALELHTELVDGGMPGNSVVDVLTDDTLAKLSKYGDEAFNLIKLYGNDAIKIIVGYGDDGLSLLQKHGRKAIDALNAVGADAASVLVTTLDDDVLEYAITQGPDAFVALSRWSKEDLEEHGMELALRAKKDADVLADIKELVSSGTIDPKNLTEEQLELITQIAANSTQYADEGQVVLGKWVDISNGFVQTAQETGSVHYNPHPDMWNLLGDLGNENQNEVAWLINQQVVQTGIEKGLPFEYTLNGISSDNVDKECDAVEALFSGKTEKEIKQILETNYIPIRIKELQELQSAGYELTFDDVNNSYIFIKP